MEVWRGEVYYVEKVRGGGVGVEGELMVGEDWLRGRGEMCENEMEEGW